MNLEMVAENEVNNRVVRGPVSCAMCSTSTKIGFVHGTMVVCIHCHFEVVERIM